MRNLARFSIPLTSAPVLTITRGCACAVGAVGVGGGGVDGAGGGAAYCVLGVLGGGVGALGFVGFGRLWGIVGWGERMKGWRECQGGAGW